MMTIWWNVWPDILSPWRSEKHVMLRIAMTTWQRAEKNGEDDKIRFLFLSFSRKINAGAKREAE
jgi:hypothetical protein